MNWNHLGNGRKIATLSMDADERYNAQFEYVNDSYDWHLIDEVEGEIVACDYAFSLAEAREAAELACELEIAKIA